MWRWKAYRMMQKLQEAKPNLSSGQTQELKIRIGLNSGSIRAGADFESDSADVPDGEGQVQVTIEIQRKSITHV